MPSARARDRRFPCFGRQVPHATAGRAAARARARRQRIGVCRQRAICSRPWRRRALAQSSRDALAACRAAARGAGEGRLCAPLPRRSSLAQHRRDRRASRCCSTPSSSTIRSPRSMCCTISPSCSWISASAGLALTRTTVLNAYLDEEGSTRQSARPRRASAVLVDAGDDQGEGRAAACGQGRPRTRPRAAREEARAYFELARSFHCARRSRAASSPSADCRAAASRRWRARIAPPYRRVSRRGPCAERCRA